MFVLYADSVLKGCSSASIQSDYKRYALELNFTGSHFTCLSITGQFPTEGKMTTRMITAAVDVI